MKKPNVALKTKIFEVGITQDELARKVGVSKGTISALVQGKYELKQFRMMQKIAKILGTTTDDLWPPDNEE